MGRKQFTFYESFYKAVSHIADKSDRADAYDAICAYALTGELPEMSEMNPAVAIAFELIKPNLDSSRKKSAVGKNKEKTAPVKSEAEPSATKCNETESNATTCNEMKSNFMSCNDLQRDATNCNENVNKKEEEKEKEVEVEKEYECNNIYSPCSRNYARMRDPELAKAANAYMNMINPTPSQTCMEELQAFVEEMGADAVIEAFNVALDEKQARWSYVQGILRNYHAAGVRCLADEQRMRKERDRKKANKGGNSRNTGQLQRHDQVSTLGKQAIAKMLEEGESG